MTSPSNRTQALATVGQVVFYLSLVVGVVLAAVTVWGVLEARSQEAAQGPDVVLAGNQGVVPMSQGAERTVYVDGPSLPTAECTVTAPDGAEQTLKGFNPVGRPRLGTHALGDLRAEVTGDHQVRCTGVEQASVSDELDPLRRSLLAVPALAGAFLVVGVLPTAVVSLVVWRMARRR